MGKGKGEEHIEGREGQERITDRMDFSIGIQCYHVPLEHYKKLYFLLCEPSATLLQTYVGNLPASSASSWTTPSSPTGDGFGLGGE